MDYVRQLGMLAIASRIKRLSDRFIKGGIEVYKELGIDFEPSLFTAFYLLSSTSGQLSVSNIAESLKLSHSAIVQISHKLEKKGLIESHKDEIDARKRILSISEKGKTQFSKLEPLWDDFEKATTQLFKECGVDILDSINKIEKELDKRELKERILKLVKERQYQDIEILDFNKKFVKDFKAINYEWIKEYFKVEESDEFFLSDPEGTIIKKGGLILFASLDGDIVGTVALVKMENEIFEIAKLGVLKKARGRQVGKRLVSEIIKKAKTLGAKRIYLRVNRKQTEAVHLYHNFGFVVTKHQKALLTHRERDSQSITMKLELK